jgi:hypothetical protein
MVSISGQLSNALGRNDEGPNIALAEKIARTSNKDAVRELVFLMNNKKTAIRHDAIKVIYETGERKPELINPYKKDFLQLLNHSDNWMQWGAMSALYAIAKFNPDLVAKNLPDIIDAMDSGSVITRDHGIYILCSVSTLKKHHNYCMELLLEQIEKAPVNQVPMYAEKMGEVISQPFIKKLEKVLLSRKDVREISSKQKRIDKLLKKLNSLHSPV